MTLKEIVGRVNEWASWTLRLESSGLGYPSCTAEAKATGGSKRPHGPIVPNMVVNPKAAEIDRILRYMPSEMHNLIRFKHVSGVGTDLDRARQYSKANGWSLATYYKREKEAYWFIGGALSTRRNMT